MNLIISEGRQELLNYVSGATGLTSGQSSSRVQQSENIMKQTLSRLQEAAKAGVIELFPLKSDIMRGERNLNKFRKENGLAAFNGSIQHFFRMGTNRNRSTF